MRVYHWRGATWKFSAEDAERLGLTDSVADEKAAEPAENKRAKPARNKGA